MKIIKQNTKTLITRDNGRSSDAVSPNFIYGCLGGCMNSYCYVGRYNHDKVYVNENIEEILNSVTNWIESKVWEKVPNQCDPKYYTIDIGCSTDVSLMYKYYNWQEVFDYFNQSEKAKSTFATKYPKLFLKQKYKLDPNKNRIRVSLMPQIYSNILEPGTNSIVERIEEILVLQKHLEVHINFSPIIYEDSWLEEYKYLFELIDSKGIQVKSECIFLTHNKHQHERNSIEVQNLLWKPQIQESKDSQYAADNIRYERNLKSQMIKDFKELYSNYFPLDSIRYIF